MATKPFHVMLKPRGSICNLDCKYCYFLSKEKLYPNSDFRMSDELLEEYTRQYIESQPTNQVTFAWQGGEPTLMGLDFFRRAVQFQQKYSKPEMQIHNAIQTNGVLLDEDWCQFFKKHQFLVGISIDGPAHLHDVYRVDKGDQPTFERVMHGLNLLKEHKVEFNVLTTVHAANANSPLEVYHFLRDEVGAKFIQFIPIVERQNKTGFQEGHTVTERAVKAESYGQFLISIFDDWVRHDVGQIFVQIFDVALAAWMGDQHGLCIFEETCGQALAMEHNGDLFSCDHFVEPNYKLGNLLEIPINAMVESPQQIQFGKAKRDTLPQYCKDCEVRFVCNGGCPKNRFIKTPDNEAGLNYLCAGYRSFFNHIREAMDFMANQLRQRRPPADIMFYMRQKDTQLEAAFAKTGRNEACPCGSGIKFKKCHGKKR